LRKEIEKVVMETIESPLLQTKWQELIKKSGESGGSKEKGKEESGGQEGQGQDGGGS